MAAVFFRKYHWWKLQPIFIPNYRYGVRKSLRLEYGKDFMATTPHLVLQTSLKNSEVVFAGYGIVAPEYDWNDYKGLDVKGKTVIVLVNDPGYASGDSALFNGRAMTYYGRWTYKFEEAARQGAKGIFVVHETGPAGYPWSVVENSWTGRAILSGVRRSQYVSLRY